MRSSKPIKPAVEKKRLCRFPDDVSPASHGELQLQNKTDLGFRPMTKVRARDVLEGYF